MVEGIGDVRVFFIDVVLRDGFSIACVTCLAMLLQFGFRADLDTLKPVLGHFAADFPATPMEGRCLQESSPLGGAIWRQKKSNRDQVTTQICFIQRRPYQNSTGQPKAHLPPTPKLGQPPPPPLQPPPHPHPPAPTPSPPAPERSPPRHLRFRSGPQPRAAASADCRSSSSKRPEAARCTVTRVELEGSWAILAPADRPTQKVKPTGGEKKKTPGGKFEGFVETNQTRLNLQMFALFARETGKTNLQGDPFCSWFGKTTSNL